MTMLLGGRAAEQLVFGSITTGASDDLRARRRDRARDGPRVRDGHRGHARCACIDDGAAEATRRVRDDEVRELADEAFRAALRDHRRHRAAARRAGRDAARATRCSSASDIDRIMGDVPRAAPRRIGGSCRSPRPRRSSRPPSARRPTSRSARAPVSRPPVSSRADAGHDRPRRRRRGGHRRGAGAVPRRRSGCRSCTARRSPSRASTRRCSTSATATSSCSRRSGPRPPVGKFLAARGPGPAPRRLPRRGRRATTLSALAAAGLRLIDERPRTGIRGSRVAFLHPASHRRRPDRDRPAGRGALTDGRRQATEDQHRLPRRPGAERARRARRADAAARRARHRGLARRSPPRTARSRSTSAGRLRARRPRGAPGRLRDLTGVAPRRPARAPDGSRPRRAACSPARAATRPALERAVGAYSRLGEHAACWFALGLAGAALGRDPRGARRWLRGLGVVVGAYGLNYAVKVAVRRRRPELPGLPPLTPTVSQLSFPSAHATTSFAAARAYVAAGAGRAAVRRRGGARAQPPVPRRSLPERRARRAPLLGHRDRPGRAAAMKVGIVGHAQRRQVLAVHAR